ncbi:OmpA family protein, partial [Burkholderia ubonensis]|uniref:OmpA family protein n=1 Tax=Burkholderia ubonensis TaxID=101571 RepID=UPI000755468B
MSQVWKAVTVLSMAALVGCTSSGPTYSAYSVRLPNGGQAYRVTCTGLFGADACQRKAQEICADQMVRPLENVAPIGSAARELTFGCGAVPQPQPQPAPVPQPAPTPALAPKQLTLSGDTTFPTGRADLTPAARQRLDQLVADARGAMFNAVVVKGYTDSVGSAAFNLKLSARRAQTVAGYLQAHGVQARQFVAHGFGKADPVASNATAQGRAQNRRVDI